MSGCCFRSITAHGRSRLGNIICAVAHELSCACTGSMGAWCGAFDPQTCSIFATLTYRASTYCIVARSSYLMYLKDFTNSTSPLEYLSRHRGALLNSKIKETVSWACEHLTHVSCPDNRDIQQENCCTIAHSSTVEISVGGQRMLQYNSDSVSVPVFL